MSRQCITGARLGARATLKFGAKTAESKAKFSNPVSKKIEPKQMYCEKLDDVAVCGGIYK
jgi:hypothetical protein